MDNLFFINQINQNNIIFEPHNFRYCNNCNDIVNKLVIGEGVDYFKLNNCESIIDIKEIKAICSLNQFKNNFKQNLKLLSTNTFNLWKYPNIQHVGEAEFKFRLKLSKLEFETQVIYIISKYLS